MYNRVDHTGFVVEDLEQSLAFYRDVLGFTVVMNAEISGETFDQIVGYENAHIKNALLKICGDDYLELIEYVYPPGEEPSVDRKDTGASHLGLEVEDIDALYEDVADRGLSFLNPPVDWYDDDGQLMLKVSYASDPDGNWLELIEVVGDGYPPA